MNNTTQSTLLHCRNTKRCGLKKKMYKQLTRYMTHEENLKDCIAYSLHSKRVGV